MKAFRTVAIVALTAVLAGACFAQEASSDYAETFKRIMNATAWRRDGILAFPTTLTLRKYERHAKDGLKRLDEPEAVPFLIGVLLNGPGWTDEALLTRFGGVLPHVARCVAASLLGDLEDPRALEPLLDVVRSGTFQANIDIEKLSPKEREAYDIRVYAARALGDMGDDRAVDELIGIARNGAETRQLRKTCVRSLADIRDMRTLPVVIDLIDELGQSTYHLEWMTRVDLDIERVEGKRRKYTVEQFPELGEIDSTFEAWRHWFEVREEWTRAQVAAADEGFARLKKSTEEKPYTDQEKERAIELYRRGWVGRIGRLGVAALPFIVEKIEEGNTEFIPLMAKLSGREISKDAGAAEVVSWWLTNREGEYALFDYGRSAPIEPVMPETPES